MKNWLSFLAKSIFSRYERQVLAAALRIKPHAADIAQKICDDGGNTRFVSYIYRVHTIRGVKDAGNLGDDMQTIATENAARTICGGNAVFESCYRDKLTGFSVRGGGAAVAIMQAWFGSVLGFLPSKNVVPVWVGTHFAYGAQRRLQLLREYFPKAFPWTDIGCRDTATLKFLQALGIDSYFSRCLTLTLPRRDPAPTQTRVFCVGISDEIRELLPREIVGNAEFVNQQFISIPPGADTPGVERYRKAADAQLARYRNDAALVVTSALHCAQPCIASGIPVVFIRPHDDGPDRFSSMQGIIPLYTPDDLREGRINWKPAPAEIEPLKADMLENLKMSLDKALGKTVNTAKLAEIRRRIAEFSVV